MSTLLRRNIGFLICLAAAAVCAGIIWFALPHDREVKSLGIFLFKLVPFIFAAEALARLDVAFFQRIKAVRVLVPVAFMVYFLYFVPKIFFYAEDHPNLYYHILTLTPMIILSFVLAFRLGGGDAGTSRRLSYALLLIMLSGAEDLAYLTVNTFAPPYDKIPAVWDWASHMTVFLGHPASKYEAFAFIAVHLVLAALALFAPAAWFAKLNPWRRNTGTATAAAGTVEREPAQV
jgi:hypothetical protein